MTPWTCAKCGTTVDAGRSICRSCGSARAVVVDSGPPDKPPPRTSVEARPGTEIAPNTEEPDVSDDGDASAAPWECGKCRTMVEGNFEVCWQCGTSRVGVADPAFRRLEDAASAPPEDVPGTGSVPDPETRPPGRPPGRTCVACGETLVPIQLIETSGRYGLRHSELQYTAGDAQSGWFGSYPVEGIIRAQLCPRCGRVGLRDPARFTHRHFQYRAFTIDYQIARSITSPYPVIDMGQTRHIAQAQVAGEFLFVDPL